MSTARLLSLIALVGAAAALIDMDVSRFDADVDDENNDIFLPEEIHSAAMRGPGKSRETTALPKRAFGMCAPGEMTFVQTSVRFKTQLLDELAPTWPQDALLLKQIGRALGV